MTLFLKYRPQNFADLVGQVPVRKTLQNALEAQNPAHAYLFTGSRGTGKTSTARIFAKALNCTDLQNGDPCLKCNTCVQTKEGTLIDVVEIDAASNRGIDEIRDLREKIKFAPSIAKRKIYIIDEVHMLTKEAFNALLKTLEEPPDHAYFCLATTEMNKIPETILSRCQVFIFQRFTEKQLIDRLDYVCEKEKFKVEPKALNLIAKKAEGGMRDALSLLEQIVSETGNNITEVSVQESLGISSKETLESFFTALVSADTDKGLEVLKKLSQNGQDLRSFGHDFLGFLREKMFDTLKEKGDLSPILNIIEIIEKALFQLKTSPIMELPLEMAVIKLTQNISKVVVKVESKIIKPVIEKKEIKKIEDKIKEKENKEEKEKNDPFNGFEFDDMPDIPKSKTDKVETNEITNTSSQSFDIGTISKHLEVIAQKARLPIFAKKSFLMMTVKVQGSQISFYTDSSFHKTQIAKPEILESLKNTIEELFSLRGVKVECLENNKSINTSASETVTADDFLDF